MTYVSAGLRYFHRYVNPVCKLGSSQNSVFSSPCVFFSHSVTSNYLQTMCMISDECFGE
jgi:hypothetical protein